MKDNERPGDIGREEANKTPGMSRGGDDLVRAHRAVSGLTEREKQAIYELGKKAGRKEAGEAILTEAVAGANSIGVDTAFRAARGDDAVERVSYLVVKIKETTTEANKGSRVGMVRRALHKAYDDAGVVGGDLVLSEEPVLFVNESKVARVMVEGVYLKLMGLARKGATDGD